MNTTQLLIPQDLSIGFQNRSDTYTGKLGYVIYKDAKGVLRKQTSWDGWRDKKIEPITCKNEPTEGFVLNRDVGGGRAHHGWDARIEKVRVWDPRGWEFEISIPNLLNIMRDCACSPGKGIEGKLVYSWSGATGPVLLPVVSQDYAKSMDFSGLQGLGVKARQLVPGHTYRTKAQKDWVFLGKLDFFYSLGDVGSYKLKKGDTGQDKRLVFAELADGKWRVVYQKDPKALAVVVSEAVADNFAELLELHTRSARGSKITKLLLKPGGEIKTEAYRSFQWWIESSPGQFTSMQTEHNGDNKPIKTMVGTVMSVQDGILHTRGHEYGGHNLYAYHPNYREKRYIGFRHGFNRDTDTVDVQPTSPNPWIEPTSNKLYALLECGAEVEIGPWSITKE